MKKVILGLVIVSTLAKVGLIHTHNEKSIDMVLKQYVFIDRKFSVEAIDMLNSKVGQAYLRHLVWENPKLANELLMKKISAYGLECSSGSAHTEINQSFLLKLIGSLIKNGVNINGNDFYAPGHSNSKIATHPLIQAIHMNDFSLVHIMLSHMHPTAVNRVIGEGEQATTALEQAIKRRTQYALSEDAKQAYEIIIALLKHGANPILNIPTKAISCIEWFKKECYGSIFVYDNELLEALDKLSTQYQDKLIIDKLREIGCSDNIFGWSYSLEDIKLLESEGVQRYIKDVAPSRLSYDISAGAIIRYPYAKGITKLFYFKVIEQFLKNGMDLNKDRRQPTETDILVLVIQTGDAELTRLFLSHMSPQRINQEVPGKGSALRYAIIRLRYPGMVNNEGLREKYEIILALLEYGANPLLAVPSVLILPEKVRNYIQFAKELSTEQRFDYDTELIAALEKYK